MNKRMRATKTHSPPGVSRTDKTAITRNPLKDSEPLISRVWEDDDAVLSHHPVDEDQALEEASAEEMSAGMPRSIRFHREGAQDLVLKLYMDKVFLLGRGPQCNVVFLDDAVSREHARLSTGPDGQWVLRDLGSRNGTFIMRGPVPPGQDHQGSAHRLHAGDDVSLKVGDVVLLGNFKNRLVFQAEAAAGSAPQPRSKVAHELEEAIRIAARHRLPVFLLGPSGSGKTYVARQIHEAARMTGDFVLVNCGRLPREAAQLQSELLGHVKGAFTGAAQVRKGKFQQADHGTLFLDEVEYLPDEAQDFLIDLLGGSNNYASFAPLGASPHRVPPPKVRIIAASKKPLAHSGLRADLCERLAAADIIALPTLDQRKGDIPALVEGFLRELREQREIHAQIEADAVMLLQRQPWPGQIRELEFAVKVAVEREHARLTTADGLDPAGTVVITVAALKKHLQNRKIGFGEAPGSVPDQPAAAPVPDPIQTRPADPAPIRKRPRDLTREDLEAALRKHGNNKSRAAAELGVAFNTLKERARALGLKWDEL